MNAALAPYASPGHRTHHGAPISLRELIMTTRPLSVRMNHQRVQRRSRFMGLLGVVWLVCGAALVVTTNSWWAWSFVAVGILTATLFFGLLPRLRRARRDLAHVEQLRVEQEAAAKAQAAARTSAFSQPALRSPFPSR